MKTFMMLFRHVVAILLLLLPVITAAATPGRIVSGAPSFTEILYALGLDQEIVGTTTYCDYPSKAMQTTKIGDVLNPNVEKIIELKPDVVFCGAWKWNVPQKLKSVGIQVVEVQDAETVQQVFERILLFGEKVDRAEKAKAIVAGMQKELKNLKSRPRQHAKRVYVEVDAGNWTVGAGSYLNEILQIVGLVNIFHDRREPYLMVTLESILSRNPDLIFSLGRTKQEYQQSIAWKGLPAVQRGRILDKNGFDWNMLTRQSPRLIEGIRRLDQMIGKMVE